MKKNILLVRSNPVNPDPPVEKMANVLLELGYCVTILGWNRDNNASISEEIQHLPNGDVKKILINIKASFGAGFRGNLKPLCTFEYELLKWLNSNGSKYNVIHSFDFDTGLVNYRYCKKHKIRHVYHILDYYVDSHNIRNALIRKFVSKTENMVINKSNAVIICTEKRIEQIHGSNPHRLFVIHNTPDSNQVDKNISVIRSSTNRMKIVYVGILANSRMLKEIADIVSRDNRYELHIGGFGKLDNFFKSMDKKHENIFYYGKMPYVNTLSLESDGDIMVAIYDPSVRNNQYSAPNKFYEALMLGKPLIMAKGTGFDEIIESEQIGEVVEFSYNGVKFGLQNMYNSMSKWKTIAQRENKMYANDYSWDIMKKRIKKLYDSVLV